MASRTLDVIQRLFGLCLVASIVADLLGWTPPEVTGKGKALMDAILASGYIFTTIRVVYVLAGIAFLLDRFAALGAILLFPISLNILLFHSVLHRSSMPQAMVFFALNCAVLYAHRSAYRPLLRPQREAP